jgi:hypothetical protein
MVVDHKAHLDHGRQDNRAFQDSGIFNQMVNTFSGYWQAPILTALKTVNYEEHQTCLTFDWPLFKIKVANPSAMSGSNITMTNTDWPTGRSLEY